MNWYETKQHIAECVAADIANGYLYSPAHTEITSKRISTKTDCDITDCDYCRRCSFYIPVLEFVPAGWVDDYEIEQYAHEFADGCAWVIYNYQAEALWHDSHEVSDYEEDILDWIDPNANINERSTACVYRATAEAVLDAVDAIRYEGVA